MSDVFVIKMGQIKINIRTISILGPLQCSCVINLCGILPMLEENLVF
jgi:hypothetical protein